MTLELAVIICLADPGAEDEGGSRRENHIVEVRQALDREVTESPYLARQLSVFDDRQLIMGVPKTVFEGLRRTLNSTVNAKRQTILNWFGPSCRVTAFTSSRRIAFCVELII